MVSSKIGGSVLGKSIPKVRAVPGDALSEIPLGPFDSLGVTVQRHRHAMCIRFARNLVPYCTGRNNRTTFAVCAVRLLRPVVS